MDDPVGTAIHVPFVVEPVDLVHQRDGHHHRSPEERPLPVEFLAGFVRERPLKFILECRQRIAEVFFHQLVIGEVRLHPKPGEELEKIRAPLVGIVAKPDERLDVGADDVIHGNGLAASFKRVFPEQIQPGLVDRHEPTLQYGVEQAILVFEIVVNHGHVDIRHLHHLAQRRGRHTVLAEQPLRSVQQQNAGFFSLIQAIAFVSHAKSSQLTN